MQQHEMMAPKRQKTSKLWDDIAEAAEAAIDVQG